MWDRAHHVGTEDGEATSPTGILAAVVKVVQEQQQVLAALQARLAGAQKGTAHRREQIDQRLQELRAEYEAGQRMLAELEAKQRTLRDTLLRISGAIQVIEELLAVHAQESVGGAAEPAESITSR